MAAKSKGKYCAVIESPRFDSRDAIVGVTRHIKRCFTSERLAKKAVRKLQRVYGDYAYDDPRAIFCTKTSSGHMTCSGSRKSRKGNVKRKRARSSAIPF